MKKVVELFIQFFKFGMVTFGGGWSIVAQMQQLYVDKKKSIASEELLDIVSVGRSLPGTMIGNVAMLFGYREAGILGGFACVLGMILPPMIVLTFVTYFYWMFQDNVWVSYAMAGVRAAIVPIIGTAVLGMFKGAFALRPCYVVALLAIILYTLLHVGCIWIVLIGMISGLLICELNERTERRHR